jgi:hypothetical protein
MIEGVLRHDTEMEVERQYVDTRTPLLQTNAYAMTARHALAAGIATKVGSHSFGRPASPRPSSRQNAMAQRSIIEGRGNRRWPKALIVPGPSEAWGN